MPEIYKTPDERFADLDDYAFAPHWFETPEGLDMHYVDEGKGPPILMLHGEPTWSYLYRRFVGPLVEAGYRAIVPDLIGFGKSDKVTDDQWYTIERHIHALDAFIHGLDLEDIVLVVHDWGGPIGLRQAADMPERFTRIFILNSWLHHRDMEYSPAIEDWHALATSPDFRDMPTGAVVRSNLENSPRGLEGLDPAAIKAAYDAPFPTVASKAGARRFPALLPFADPEAGNAADQTRVYLSVRTFPGPVHVMFGGADDIFPDSWGREWARQIAGATYDAFEGGAHFVQEQYGPEIVAKMLEYMSG